MSAKIDPTAVGVNRTVTRTKFGAVTQYVAFSTIERSGLISVTVPHSVPLPEFEMSKVRSRLCPTGTEPKSRLWTDNAQVGGPTAAPTAVSVGQSCPIGSSGQ